MVEVVTMGINWTEADQVILLAWLDFCVQHDLNFIQTIEDHMKRAKNEPVEAEVPFTLMQIKNKFTRLLRKVGQPWDPKLAREKGSKYFQALPKDFRTAIQGQLASTTRIRRQ